jgi:hypothetical protein
MLKLAELGAEILDPVAGGRVAAAGGHDAFEWRHSSFCNGGSCVEIAARGESVAVRVADRPDGPTLVFPACAWRDFVAAIKSSGLR